MVQYLNDLSAILHHFAQFYGDKAMEVEDMNSGHDTLIQCPLTRSGRPGRPSIIIIISKAQIETLIEIQLQVCSGSVQGHFCIEEVTMSYPSAGALLKSVMVT